MATRAAENLDFVRRTMEQAREFKALPTSGGVLMGLMALAAALLANRMPTSEAWLAVWLLTAVLAASIAARSIVSQSRRRQVSVFGASARRFLTGLIPGLAAGAVLTMVFYSLGAVEKLPGLWLLLYGAATLSAGLHSVRPIPLLGLCLMSLGTAAFFLPPTWGDAMLAAGFGCLHIAFGAYLWRSYGG